MSDGNAAGQQQGQQQTQNAGNQNQGADNLGQQGNQGQGQQGQQQQGQDNSQGQGNQAGQQQQQDQDTPADLGKVTFPEGVERSDELMKEFEPVAKELGLNQDEAQSLITLHSNWVLKEQQAQEQTFTETIDGWRADAQKDQEIGGEKFEGNLEVAKGALEKFGTDALTEALRLTGMSNHPEMVRLLYRVGKAMGEDQLPSGGHGGGEQNQSAAKKLFPNQN